MRFYMSGDVYLENGRTASVPEVNERKEPEMYIRGILPWTNFPQSATVYSYEDWKFIIDQCARMRMNFIMYHNYNGTCGHNEMFQNFEYRGFLSRNWMPTVKSGHGWQCPGWDIKDYQFGASEIYDDYDFGADYGMHNETLSNRQIADKGSSMFRKIIRYAHTRGVKIGLGLDIDLIPQDYKAYGADAAEIPGKDVTSGGLEYYIVASDGTNTSRYPVSDCGRCMTVSVSGGKGCFDTAVDARNPGDGSIIWDKVEGATIYRIYRSTSAGFRPDNTNYLTIAGRNSTRYADFNADYEGKPLKGTYYYRVVAIDENDNMSEPSKAVKVVYE